MRALGESQFDLWVDLDDSPLFELVAIYECRRQGYNVLQGQRSTGCRISSKQKS